ncbi:MAG: hypothetical protein NWE98_01380 [Candidatus Bathyarchaeota archaeon]|nr:hypothetical protein [Candidatus Bathyarchaeota archaeon]
MAQSRCRAMDPKEAGVIEKPPKKTGSGNIIGFKTIPIFQIFSALNCRSQTESIFTLGFFKNKYLLMP